MIPCAPSGSSVPQVLHSRTLSKSKVLTPPKPFQTHSLRSSPYLALKRPEAHSLMNYGRYSLLTVLTSTSVMSPSLQMSCVIVASSWPSPVMVSIVRILEPLCAALSKKLLRFYLKLLVLEILMTAVVYPRISCLDNLLLLVLAKLRCTLIKRCSIRLHPIMLDSVSCQVW